MRNASPAFLKTENSVRWGKTEKADEAGVNALKKGLFEWGWSSQITDHQLQSPPVSHGVYILVWWWLVHMICKSSTYIVFLGAESYQGNGPLSRSRGEVDEHLDLQD